MASTGFTPAGAGADLADALSSWTTPGNITADDATYATASATPGFAVNTLKASNFGLSVPTGAVIDGVETRVQASIQSAALGGATFSSVNIGTSDIVLGTAKSPSDALTVTDTDYDDGSSTDVWGLTLTPALVNATDFQIRVVFTGTGIAGAAVDVDAIWVNVHFTLGGARNRGWVIG